MTTRTVKTKILKGDGTPWSNARVNFVLINNSFTDTAQYPKSTVRALTNQQGEMQADLWINTEGDKPTKWRCFLPSKESFEFNIPPGSTPIEVSVLREDYQEGTPQYNSLITYIDDYIDDLIIPGSEQYQMLAIAPGQNIFNLSSIPTQPQKSRLYWNGLKVKFGQDYTINSAVLTTFINRLDNADLLEIYYL